MRKSVTSRLSRFVAETLRFFGNAINYFDIKNLKL